ncbi:kinase-like domain-containing protein [Chytridium lagenaria]|nr:kinase-like domain-containing protein [Chytridium lagenaria]
MSATGTPKAKKKASLGLKLDSLPPSEEFDSPSQAKPLTTVDLSLPPQFSDMKIEDIDIISELGVGNGGTVNKIMHKPTSTLMARKIIHVEARRTIQKQILRELQILKNCNSPFIVSFYGAFINMKSLEEDVLEQITLSVLKGLVYLYQEHKIIHRDVKPSNILLNSAGQVKMADFGVSGELTNSMVKTFVGTSAYMSPERIKGNRYSVQCDVWSLGISLMELAMGSLPPLTLFELLECIVEEPLPNLPDGRFSQTFQAFIGRCLIKDDAQRPKPQELLSDPFCTSAEASTIDMRKWAANYLKIANADTNSAADSLAKMGLEGR